MSGPKSRATVSSESSMHEEGFGTEVTGNGALPEELVTGWEGGSSTTVGAWEVDGWLIMLLRGQA